MAKDLVEIVRCKDCIHRPDEYGYPVGDDWRCPCVCSDDAYTWCPDDDWFCAEGEMKGEE